MPTQATTTTLERLEALGVELKWVHYTPKSYGSDGWELVGVADSELTYYADEDGLVFRLDSAGRPCPPRGEIGQIVERMEPSDIQLEHDLLRNHLNWRGRYHDGGWAVNVKLHNQWDYNRKWPDMECKREDCYESRERYGIDHDYWESYWERLTEHHYECFLEDEHYFKLLDRGKFYRDGGYICYESETLALDEAEALVDLYENTMPYLVDDACRDAATHEAAYKMAHLLDLEVEYIEYESFALTDAGGKTITISINYGPTKQELDEKKKEEANGS